jgi:hypothetical protein
MAHFDLEKDILLVQLALYTQTSEISNIVYKNKKT